ncbi:MAG: AsmA family protein, partial [Burkholderiales bacterium]
MRTRRRIVGVLAALVGLPILAILLAIVVVAVFGVSIDASRWRAALAERAGAVLGRPVRFDGPLMLELRRDVVLRARDVHVLGPPEFAERDLVSIGTAQLSVDLLAALRGRVHVRNIELADGRVHLARSGAGGANWASPTPSNEATEPGTGHAPVRTVIEVERLSVRNVEVEYQDARSGVHRLLDLEELAGTGESGQPLKLTARGRVRGAVSCALDLAGASIQELLVADRAWLFTVDAKCAGTRMHASGALESGRRVARFQFGVG